jgi:hypothetical protein
MVKYCSINLGHDHELKRGIIKYIYTFLQCLDSHHWIVEEQKEINYFDIKKNKL